MNGDGCLVHAHEEPVTLVPLHLRPPGRGGMNSPVVTVCANTAAGVYALLERIEAYATISPLKTPAGVVATLPADVWGNFTAIERVIAYRAWFSYGHAFLRGDYEEVYRCWRADGTAKLSEIPSMQNLAVLANLPRRYRRRMARW